MTVSEKLAAGIYANNMPYKSHRQDADANAAYEAVEARRISEFRHDVATECGVLGHPQEQKLWDLTWSYGHSSGLEEVWNYYQDFAVLLCMEKHAKARKRRLLDK